MRFVLQAGSMVSAFVFALFALSSAVPERLQGRYADALGSCRFGSSINIRASTVEWNGRVDLVVFAEQLSPSSAHLFIQGSNDTQTIRELHFEAQGENGNHLIVIDHLVDAQDIVRRGGPIPDKSVVGFYQRCENERGR
ncbi:hypothetical protein [Sphingomonas sp. Leaf4]|uniref:hypothetical protein n=1 Tax=Sphingomonas sp. Leaf4 TaxID=2876553 RepID=UPI001E613E7C|nr:hypothetical protein [Sphingomonas sp. Leaf4]